jgi:methyltransferase (TIGR00027 family)
MPRTNDDTWDLASSVGATATLVAAARAVASRSTDPVIEDPFAEPLVRAVGVDFFTKLATGELKPEQLDGGESPVGMRRFADGMAARTKFFDEFFEQAFRADSPRVRQAVILASGLDARSYRLDWPDGMVVFEIDQPEVIAFKKATLAALGAEPTADLRPVAADLRHDWPAALTDAGFDPTQPTAWIAEGLFGYLPPEAQDRLLDQISALSPAGSRVAAESVAAQHRQPEDGDDDAVRQRMQAAADRWRAHGFDIDFSELVFLGDRSEVGGYLQAHGWTTTAQATNELLVKYGLTPLDSDEGFADVTYISAVK